MLMKSNLTPLFIAWSLTGFPRINLHDPVCWDIFERKPVKSCKSEVQPKLFECALNKIDNNFHVIAACSVFLTRCNSWAISIMYTNACSPSGGGIPVTSCSYFGQASARGIPDINSIFMPPSPNLHLTNPQPEPLTTNDPLLPIPS